MSDQTNKAGDGIHENHWCRGVSDGVAGVLAGQRLISRTGGARNTTRSGICSRQADRLQLAAKPFGARKPLVSASSGLEKHHDGITMPRYGLSRVW